MSHSIRTFVVAFLFLSIHSVSATPQGSGSAVDQGEKRSPVDVHLQNGNQFLRNRDPSQAIKQYEMASQAEPDDPRPFYCLGLANLSLRRYSPAKASLLKAIELDSRHYKAHRVVGDILTLENDNIRAIWWYHKALSLAPDDKARVNEYLRLASTYKSMRLPHDAIEALEAVLKP